MAHDDEVPGEEPSLRRKAARGSAVTLAAQAMKVLLSLLGVVVLSRMIAPSDFGLVAMVTAISGMGAIFLDFGLSMSALRASTVTHQQQSNLFWLNVTSGVLLGMTVFALAHPIATFYGDERLAAVAQWLALTYVMGGLTAQFRVSLNRAMRFRALAVAEVVAPLAGLVAAVATASLGYGVAALVIQQLVLFGVTLILSAAFARWVPGLPRRGAGTRPFLSFGVKFAATQALSYATQNIDSIAIGKVWGSASLGVYDRAFRLSVAPISQLNVPMTRVAMPVLTRVVGDPLRYVAALREAQLVACYVTASVLLILGGLGSPLVLVLLGPSWAPAGPVFTILAISATFRSAQQVANWILISQGMAGALLKWNLLAQPLIIGFILAGLPWGIQGVAGGAAVGYGLYWLGSLLWAGRATNLNLRPLMVDALRAIGTFGLPAGLVAYLVTVFVDVAPLWQLAIGLSCALCWCAASYLVFSPVRNDLRKLAHFGMLAVGRR